MREIVCCSLKMRIFFLIDQQDWKGHSVPRGCPVLHWVWDCLGIGCSSAKISLQHFQRHHRPHQVSNSQSVTVTQRFWRGRVSCTGCCQLWQLWIPTTGQTLGCCTSMRQTDHQILWNVSAWLTRRSWQLVLFSIWALQLRYTRGHWLWHSRTRGSSHPGLKLLLPVSSVLFQLKKSKTTT